jgi:hypothetical protein
MTKQINSGHRTSPPARKPDHASLDAAETQRTQFGPGGLWLQSVAAELGLSHPVILHHFRSREGLIDATAPHRNWVETTLGHVFGAFGNGIALLVAASAMGAAIFGRSRLTGPRPTRHLKTEAA